MKRSTDRILTTHTGSLPRPPDLLALIQAREAGEPVDENAFATRVASAVAEVVQQQAAAGIDVVSDGELGKPSFATYVTHRLAGFGGENPEPRVFADWETFPGWASQAPRGTMQRRYCLGPLGWQGDAAVQTDIANLRRAVATVAVAEAFIPAASLGIVADLMANRYYPTEAAYLYALADAMKRSTRPSPPPGCCCKLTRPTPRWAATSSFVTAAWRSFAGRWPSASRRSITR